MTTGETEAFATRLSAIEAEHIHDALDQTGLSRADLVARGLRYYLEENPDDIPAFRPDESEMDPLEKLGVASPENGADWIETQDR